MMTRMCPGFLVGAPGWLSIPLEKRENEGKCRKTNHGNVFGEWCGSLLPQEAK